MNIFEIEAEERDVKGKGASRRLRRAGKVPGILYGARSEPVSIQVSQADILLRTELEAFYSHILTLKLDGTPKKVVLKDLQRHTYKADILHLDFQRIDESEQLTMRVPLHFVNEDKCAGVKTGGGMVAHLMTELEISCLPKDLPEYIEVDIIDLELGDAIPLSDVTVPEGVRIASLLHGGNDSLPVVAVQIPRTAMEDVEAVVGEVLEGEELLEGEVGEAPSTQADGEASSEDED